MSENPQYIIGIDEAGRGPLAGPVAVGIVIVSKDFDIELVAEIKGKDSKKLNPQKREIWFKKMQAWKKEGILNYHVVLVSHSIIDTQGISFAIKKGIAECLKKVRMFDGKVLSENECMILLDGSLHAPKEYLFQKTIIKGDEKYFQISLASIAAKVLRDRKMEQLAIKYPEYGFDVHKGYGTYEHRKAIALFGVSPIHRISFLKNIL